MILRSAVVLVLLAALAGLASAENRERARQRFQEGAQHFDLGEYEQALTAFKDAYRDYADPSFLFNIGQCYRQLGDKPQAIRSYRAYLSKVPNASNRDEVKRTIESLEQALAGEQTTVFPLSRLTPPWPRIAQASESGRTALG